MVEWKWYRAEGRGTGFNRNIVECKVFSGCRFPRRAAPDLIETLWNVKCFYSNTSTIVSHRFNRDIVECKVSKREGSDWTGLDLIETLWNVKIVWIWMPIAVLRFNRDIKDLHILPWRAPALRFNRDIVECKANSALSPWSAPRRFNRDIVECKDKEWRLFPPERVTI